MNKTNVCPPLTDGPLNTASDWLTVLSPHYKRIITLKTHLQVVCSVSMGMKSMRRAKPSQAVTWRKKRPYDSQVTCCST